jgi:hypothetical protein
MEHHNDDDGEVPEVPGDHDDSPSHHFWCFTISQTATGPEASLPSIPRPEVLPQLGVERELLRHDRNIRLSPSSPRAPPA